MKLIQVCSKNDELEFVVLENIKKIMISKNDNQKYNVIFKVSDKHDVLSLLDGTPHQFETKESAIKPNPNITMIIKITNSTFT